MSSTPDLIVPHPELTVLEPGNAPDAFYVRSIQAELYANAQAVPTSLGGGDHGHLGLITSPADYLRLSAQPTPFNVPAAPVAPGLAGNVNAREQELLAYRDAKEVFRTCRAVTSLLRKQILTAVPNDFL